MPYIMEKPPESKGCCFNRLLYFDGLDQVYDRFIKMQCSDRSFTLAEKIIDQPTLVSSYECLFNAVLKLATRNSGSVPNVRCYQSILRSLPALVSHRECLHCRHWPIIRYKRCRRSCALCDENYCSEV